jgi:hypothetical protein
MTQPTDYENSLHPTKPLRPSAQILSSPLTPLNLLRIPTYQMKVVQASVSLVGKKNLELVEVYPIESSASLVFSDKKKKGTVQIPIANISDIGVVSEKKGRIRKQEDLMIQITFEDEDGQDNSIKINLEDKYIDSFYQDVETVRQNVYDITYWHYGLLTCPTDDTEPKPVDFYPSVPFLAEGEEVIWSYIRTEGILNKKAVWMNVLTNYRAFEYFFKEHKANYMLIIAIDDVLPHLQKMYLQLTIFRQ